ncbi:uncharacterized protein LOC134677437 [Cydia fagiglandana]|uniref:uncharacterized protein LOC134677437 n=1 Tax=Cydia fagiglandana TaxID=1458189 RepID=UPI002FEE4B71
MPESESPPKKHKREPPIPRRKPSVVIPGRKIVYPTPDKTTCAECTCFPKDAPYVKPAKFRPCLQTPPTLYELAAIFVDQLKFPEAFHWSEEDVAQWIEGQVGLPEYKECIMDNKINGRRLLMLEHGHHLPQIGVHSLEHIQRITSAVRDLFSTEFIKFSRSIGLPPRYPLTHCTWFKSRTGPSWGIRQNWTRCGILRAMGIIMPAPVYMDHWDLVWYQKPDFPKVKFARIPKWDKSERIPHYKEFIEEPSNEILVPRKFILEKHIPRELQLIWMQKLVYLPDYSEKKVVKKPPKVWRVVPKPVKTKGLEGKQLLLARRKMPTPKFLP